MHSHTESVEGMVVEVPGGCVQAPALTLII